MLKFLWQLFLFSWIIEGVQDFRKTIHNKDNNDEKLSKEIQRLEADIKEISKEEDQLRTASLIIYTMWKTEYQKYLEQHKSSIVAILKKYHENNTLTRNKKDSIIEDILDEMGKNGENAKKSEMIRYKNKILIHFLLYHKKEDLSDLLGLEAKKIIIERQE